MPARRTLAGVAALLAAAAIGLWILAKSAVPWPGSLGRIHYVTWLTMGEQERDTVEAATALSSPGGAVLLTSAVTVLAVRVGGWRWVWVPPLASTVAVVTTAAKHAGPNTTLPSGHAAFAAAMLGLAAWLCVSSGWRVAGASLAALGLAMGPLRVLEGNHAPVDVIAGLLTGAAWLAAVLAVAPRPRQAGWRHPL